MEINFLDSFNDGWLDRKLAMNSRGAEIVWSELPANGSD